MKLMKMAFVLIAIAMVFPLCADVLPKLPLETNSLYRSAVRRSAPIAGLATHSVVRYHVTRPDVSIVRSSIVDSWLHGKIGETLVNHKLYSSGGWNVLDFKETSQGIDNIWVKFDANGNPRGLIVGETKFENENLKDTKDGRQGSRSWAKPRLKKAAGFYRKRYEAAIKSGRNPNDSDVRKLRVLEKYLSAAADGKWDYRVRLIKVELTANNELVFKDYLLDADGNKVPGTENRIISRSGLSVKEITIIKDELIEEIKRKNPNLTYSEASSMADDIMKKEKSIRYAINSTKFGKTQIVKSAGGAFVGGAIIAGGIDSILQLSGDDDFDVERTIKTAVLGGASSVAGDLTSIGMARLLLSNQRIHASTAKIAQMIGVKPQHVGSAMTSASAGAVSSVVFAYGGYALGLYDATTANRMAVAGVAGTAAGSIASTATLAAISTWGMASTGTAICTLHGAVASNATLAWLGGGAVSAGGGGVALGSAILTAGTVVVVIAVSSGVMYGFHLYDVKQEEIRIRDTAAILEKHNGDFPGNPWASVGK